MTNNITCIPNQGTFQFGMPSGSPFSHNPMAQIGGHMLSGPQPMERMEQG